MTQLTPIQLDDGTTIYLEIKDDIPIVEPIIKETTTPQELTRESLGKTDKRLRDILPQQPIQHSFKLIEKTIKAYTNYTLNAFKDIDNGNIDKVTLEFGLKVAAKSGIPYVTEGSGESHIKITVECSFPQTPENQQ